MDKFQKELHNHLLAGYSALYIQSAEERRVKLIIREITQEQKKKFTMWSATSGLVEVDGEKLLSIDETKYPDALLSHLVEKIEEYEEMVIVICDFHHYLKDPLLLRTIRELSEKYKELQNCMIFLSPHFQLPEDLKKDITPIDFPLPTREEIGLVLKDLADAHKIKLQEKQIDKIIDSVRGLTTIEVENALSMAILESNLKGEATIKSLMGAKAATIKKSGILEYFESDSTMGEVGGFTKLKEWLKIKGKAFSKKAKEFGLTPPKGALLLGLPGCGKSLTAKSVANEWSFPLIRLDLGKVFGSLVGQSEKNMREAIQLAEAVAPVVVWVDELEKGLAGSKGGSNDSGVSARVFGTLLTWMQERKEDVFVVATCNNISALPPEFLRKGRFDEIFFVDLPSNKERKEIFKIHIEKRNREPENFNLNVLVKETKGFTGSEIEEAIVHGLFLAFSDGKAKELEDKHILQAIKSTVPLSKTMDKELQGIRSWAKDRAVNVSGEIENGKVSLKLKRKTKPSNN